MNAWTTTITSIDKFARYIEISDGTRTYYANSDDSEDQAINDFLHAPESREMDHIDGLSVIVHDHQKDLIVLDQEIGLE